MGSLWSSVQETYQPKFELTFKIKKISEQWGLTNSELNYMYNKFLELDEDNSGTIEYEEFFSFLNSPRTLFLDTMFQFMTGNSKEDLTFDVWVIVVFGFCLTSREEMIEHIFRAFDYNFNGYIELGELHALLVSIHIDNPIFPRQVVSAMTEMCLDKDGKIDFRAFKTAQKVYPMLLWPVFRLQHRMRRDTFGISFFETIEARIRDMYFKDQDSENYRIKWKKRLESIQLYLCGWPCCRRQENSISTPIEEITARKRTFKAFNAATAIRLLNPSGPKYRFRELPIREYHTPMDEKIEREYMQVHSQPLVPDELTLEPVQLQAVDDFDEAYYLSEGGSSDSGASLYDPNEEEYPDWCADSDDDVE